MSRVSISISQARSARRRALRGLKTPKLGVTKFKKFKPFAKVKLPKGLKVPKRAK